MCCLVAGCSSVPACKEQSQQRKCHYPIRINEQIPSGQASRPAGHPRIAIYSPNYYRTTTTKNSSNHNALLVNSNERHKADDIINF